MQHSTNQRLLPLSYSPPSSNSLVTLCVFDPVFPLPGQKPHCPILKESIFYFIPATVAPTSLPFPFALFLTDDHPPPPTQFPPSYFPSPTCPAIAVAISALTGDLCGKRHAVTLRRGIIPVLGRGWRCEWHGVVETLGLGLC